MKFLVVMVVAAACGGGGGQSPIDGAGDDDAGGSDGGTCTVPSTPPRTVFVNRAGGMYIKQTAGEDDSTMNKSVIIDMDRTLAPPTVVESEYTMFVDCVKSKFTPFHITITEVDPGAAAHIELVVIDTPQQIGLSNGISGVSPFACDAAAGNAPKVFESAIPFVMYGVFNQVKDRCEVAAQVIGNSLGLDHELGAADIMSFMNSVTPKEFTNSLNDCGEDTPRACMCGGTTKQNSFEHLLTTLGPSCL